MFRYHQLATPAAVAAASVLLFAAAPASAATPVHVRFVAYSGDATLTEDMGAGSDTPIFFTEQLHWTLPHAVERRVGIGHPAKVPVRITVHGSAQGVYAVLDRNGNATQHVPYQCSSRATRLQTATARIFINRNRVLRLTVSLIAAGGLDPGAARCTDSDQAQTFEFPTGTQWVASQLKETQLVTRVGAPAQPPILHAHPLHVHDVPNPPYSVRYVEREQFAVSLGFTRLAGRR
jgi:hypothetical protein